MSLAGTGAVAIWHDIAPEGREAFYAWHGEQHMPERASIPGFLRGRRYIAAHGKPEYFNLYETATTAVLTGPDYLERLNHPTDWTRSTVKHFRNVARAVCEVAFTAGRGEGGLVATFRYCVDANSPARRERASRVLRDLACERGIAGAHLLIADESGSAIETTERKARGEATEVPRSIVVVEGWGDEAPFVGRCAALAAAPDFGSEMGKPDWAVYRLQNTCTSTHRPR